MEGRGSSSAAAAAASDGTDPTNMNNHPPAQQWFSSIEDPAWDSPGPQAGSTQTQVMSPNINILETNTSVLIQNINDSVDPTEVVVGSARPFHPDHDGVQLAADLQMRAASTSPTDFASTMSTPSPRTSAAARAAASLHSEKSKQTVPCYGPGQQL